MSDYYDDPPQPQKPGSVLPWVLLTVVIVFAGVGVVAMKTQADTAVAAVEKMKLDLSDLRKRSEANDEKRQDLEKQLAQVTSDKDQLEKDKADLTKKVDDLSGQLQVTKAEASAEKGGSKKGRGKSKKIQVVSMKGHHRR